MTDLDSGVLEASAEDKVASVESNYLTGFVSYNDPTLELRPVIEENFSGLWPVVDTALSQWATLLIDDITLPTVIYLVGPPSSDKTTVISMMKVQSESYYVDDFTPASFVSHKSGPTSAQLNQVDLLPQLKGKLLLTPELNTLWSQSKDKLKSTMGILTRVLDGGGYSSHSGVHGRRGYDEPLVFAWLGATTPVPQRIWQQLGKMGSRIYFSSMPQQEFNSDRVGEGLATKTPYGLRIRNCREVIEKFMKAMRRKYPIGVTWNKQAEVKGYLQDIARYADLLAKLRCGVEKEYDHNDNSEITTVQVERPDRAAHVLYNLARGHALIHGSTQIDAENVELCVRIALSSAPPDRVKAFRLLYKCHMMRSDTFQEELKLSNKAARELIKIFELAGLIEIKPDPQGTQGRPFNILVLKKQYQSLPLMP